MTLRRVLWIAIPVLLVVVLAGGAALTWLLARRAGEQRLVVLRDDQTVQLLDSSGAAALADATVSEYTYELGTDHISAKRDGGEFETLAAGIARVRLRYRHGEEWADEFDSSAQGHVPSAVEIAVWFGAPEAPEEGKVATEEYFVLKNLCAKIDELRAAKA